MDLGNPTRSTRSSQLARSTPAAGSSSPTCCPTRSRCSAAGTTTRTRPGCTSPTPWSSRPSRPTSLRRRGWCCSRASPRRASPSTPTPAPARAPSWPATRGSRFSSRGTRSSARSASTAPHPPPARRGGRLLRGASARLPARRLGVAPVERGLRPRGAARGVRRGGAALRRRRGTDAHGVGRLPRAPGVGGVLAGAAGPDARPAGLPAYDGRLAHRAASPHNHASIWPTRTMCQAAKAT